MSDSEEEFDDVEPLTAADEQAIAALLAALPAEPMPAEVLARIEAALASEPPLEGDPALVLPTPLAARRQRNLHGPLIFRVAASVVGLLVAFGVGLLIVTSGGASSDSGATAAGAASGSVPAVASAPTSGLTSTAASGTTAPSTFDGVRQLRTGATYDEQNLATRAASLVTGLQLSEHADSAAASGAATSSALPVASATPAATLVPGATSATSTDGTGTIEKSPEHAVSATQLADTPALLRACVAELADHDGRQALAVDIGRWAGQPALVIVLPPASGTSDLEVFAVRPSCGQVNDSSDLLDFATLTPVTASPTQ
jgi:hypothetical protein